MCANDDRWSAFLRGYLEHSRRRVAWNCLLVDELAPAGATWLDVGSFGVEPLWLLRRRPDLQVRAVSYEGMGLHLAADGIRQGAPADKGAPFVQVDRTDIERDPLPLEDASCDVVTCFECIEHLRATPKPLLDEIRRVLKPDGRLLLTFTQRESYGEDRPPLGLRALVGTELDDDLAFDFDGDVIFVEAHTPLGQDSGGGFGNTVQLDDGTLVSAYSYRDADGELHCEVARWRLPG